jgi:hypothetical protein
LSILQKIEWFTMSENMDEDQDQEEYYDDIVAPSDDSDGPILDDSDDGEYLSDYFVNDEEKYVHLRILVAFVSISQFRSHPRAKVQDKKLTDLFADMRTSGRTQPIPSLPSQASSGQFPANAFSPSPGGGIAGGLRNSFTSGCASE